MKQLNITRYSKRSK